MSKGVINSITLDKTVILGSGSAEVTVDYTASGSGVFTLDDFVDEPNYLQNITVLGGVVQLTPPDNTISLKKLEIKTNNWTGVTKSDYFLINTYSGQGSGIMSALYNEHLKVKNENYSLGSGDGYAAGSGDGYLTGYAVGSGNGFSSKYSTGYAVGSGNGYLTGYAKGSDDGFRTGYAEGSGDGYAAGSGNGYTPSYAVGSGDGYSTGYAKGSGDGYTSGSGFGYNAGVESLRSANITVHPGWNIFSPVKSGSIHDSHNVIITDSLHMFNGTSYEKKNENNIEKGKGYMVKCEVSGSFTFNYS